MKRSVILILVALFLISGLVFALIGDEYQWHDSDTVIIEMNGFSVTLQDAIDNNYFGSENPILDSVYSTYFHLASEILVVTSDGHTMTLQEASDRGAFVESFENGNMSLPLGHLADDINITSTTGEVKTLQEAIGDREMACLTCVEMGYECGVHNNSCGGTVDCDVCISGICSDGICTDYSWSAGDWGETVLCNVPTTRDVTCYDEASVAVADSFCISAGLEKPTENAVTYCIKELSHKIECSSGSWGSCGGSCTDTTRLYLGCSPSGCSCTSCGSGATNKWREYCVIHYTLN